MEDREFIGSDEPVGIIYKTYDYSKFKFSPKNRDVEKYNINKLLKSLIEKNLLHCYPILVSSSLEIIFDGQHRFNVAKERGLPIYYLIDNTILIEDIPHCSRATTSWRPKNYLKIYSMENIPSYVEIKNILTQYPLLGIHSLLDICPRIKNTSKNEQFRNGTFVLTESDKDMILKIVKFADKMRSKLTVVDGDKTIPPSINCYNTNMLIAIKRIIRSVGFSETIFMNQIHKYPGKILKCSTTDEYTTILQTLYNHKLKASQKINTSVKK